MLSSHECFWLDILHGIYFSWNDFRGCGDVDLYFFFAFWVEDIDLYKEIVYLVTAVISFSLY